MTNQYPQLELSPTVAQFIAGSFHDRIVKLADPPWSRGELLPDKYERTYMDTEVCEGKSSWIEMLVLGKSYYHIGAAVFDYCILNEKSRAFVFFSMDNALIEKLLKVLAETPSLRIIYAVNLELSKVGASNLIELCYGGKDFFTERLRKRMTEERFAFSTKAFVIFFELKDAIKETTELKAKLRRNLPSVTFERRIHGTDDAEDTRYLVEALTNPNTFNLVNQVKISRHDRVFSRFPASLRFNPNVCVDGSSIMELYDLRKARDLDLICRGSDLEQEILEMGFDVGHEHYKELPFSHEDVIISPYLHVVLFGVKFTSLSTRQLVLSFGPRSAHALWPKKKMRDIRSIAEFTLGRRSARLSGIVGTSSTQLRLVFDFVVTRIMPQLPPGLARTLRSIRQRLIAS